jgi:hypothetical protein
MRWKYEYLRILVVREMRNFMCIVGVSVAHFDNSLFHLWKGRSQQEGSPNICG